MVLAVSTSLMLVRRVTLWLLRRSPFLGDPEGGRESRKAAGESRKEGSGAEGPNMVDGVVTSLPSRPLTRGVDR
jgi:hypothetical protein